MRSILFVVVVILAGYNSFAQNTLTVIDTGNITRERWRDSVLRMDKTQVPTGFLLEYSMFGFSTSKYDGVGNDDDTIKNDGKIFELHNILWYSKVNSNAVIDVTDTLYSKAFFYNLNTNIIPLSFIYQKYNRIRQTALSQGLLKIAPDSVGILDVAGRPTSPYDPYEIFAFAPFKTNITQFNAIQFTLPADLFYMHGITSVDIDFADGAGFRTISKGGAASIYYATEGIKYVTARINTTGGTRTAKCQINYKRPSVYTKPDYSLNLQADPVYTSDAQYLQSGGSSPQTNSPLIPCGDGSFIDQILCSTKPNANIEVINGCDKVFDKPIIVVEGFDPDGSLNLLEMERRFGTQRFIETMQSYGYDFVFVNFTKNTTYIENNAKVLEAVINWVNQNKTGTNKSTVIGFSMGGLISRWCLKDMEDRGLQHNVANYFSYDAPQQGSNVPLGMQYIFKEIARDLPYLRWFNAGGFRDLSNAFASPAAKQELVTYASYSNGPFNWFPDLYTLDPIRAAFAQRLQSKGYPQQTNNFGIGFGRGNNTVNKDAGDGKQFTPANPFNPQSQIFGGSIGLLLVNLQANGFAVPENNAKSTIAYYSFFGLTFRRIFGIPFIPTVTLRVRRFDYTGKYPYDDGQGSFEQTQTDFAQNWFAGVGMPATTYNHDGHNFVATASALDLQNQTYNSTTSWQSANIFYNIDNQIQNAGQVNGNKLIIPSLSPFKAVMTGTSDCTAVGGCSALPYLNENNIYIYPPNSNQWNHFHNTSITFQTALFIERNILNIQPVDCAGSNGLCNSTATISGPAILCTTGQYQLNNVPNGVTITWEFLNGRLIITNGQGTDLINVTNQSAGSETIKLTMTNTCGASLTLYKTIQVGVYTHAQYAIYSNPSSICYGYRAQFGPLAGQLPDATSYNWIYSGGLTYVSGQGTRVITLNVPTYSPFQTGGDVGLVVGNVCGVSTAFPLTHFNYSGCSCCTFSSFSITASPNPATNNINVSFTNVADTSTSSSSSLLRTIDSQGKTIMTLYDFNTNEVINQWTYNEAGNSSYNLTVGVLKKGIYVLKVDRENHTMTTKIIIE